MNLTIPIRAQSSTRSWAPQLRGSNSIKNIKADRTRYIFSMITAMLLVGTLIVGSVGSMLQVASAKDNFSSKTFNYTPTTSKNNPASNTAATSKNTTTTPTKTTTNTTTPTTVKATPAATQPAPATPAPTADAPAIVQPAATPTRASVAATTTATPQIVAQPPTPAPVDTAPAIANMSAAQADKNTQAVSYTSSSLSIETRNRILIMAGIAAITGGLLYTISFIGGAAPRVKREIPIRYIVPVREAINS